MYVTQYGLLSILDRVCFCIVLCELEFHIMASHPLPIGLFYLFLPLPRGS